MEGVLIDFRVLLLLRVSRRDFIFPVAITSTGDWRSGYSFLPRRVADKASWNVKFPEVALSNNTLI